MSDQTPYGSVLRIFAHYGFRRASMTDLADAAGVSRQTLYNRLSSKEAVLDWALEGYVRQLQERAVAELAHHELSVAECLLNAFSRWTGDNVAILRGSPHGMEIMDLGMESLKRSKTDHIAAFEAALSGFLLLRKVCASPEEAADLTFTLTMASKGLMLKSENGEAFAEGMDRIIRTVTA